MKKILAMLGALAGLSFAASAVANPIVDTWTFAETLAWSAQTYTAGGGSQTNLPDKLSWGQSGGSEALGGTRSSLGINPTAANGTVDTNGLPAITNTITHTNNVIDSSFATLATATLHNTLTLTPLLPTPGGAQVIPPIDFLIHFKETLNQAPCGFPVATTCDDVFVIDFGSLNNSFVYDTNTYFISIITTTGNLTPLDPGACAAAGSPAGCLGFTTPENAVTPVTFAFLITSQPVTVPEPSQLALLAIGLLGLYFIRGRKSQKL
ncbi:MAG: THxN family PEP-CTERM protein [Pseudomonadota bacterium]